MAGAKKTEVFLEISGGTLKIQTSDVIYHISLAGDGFGQAVRSLAPPLEPARLAEPGKPAIPSADHLAGIDLGAVEAMDAYYKQLSEDLYQEIGSLARKLSVSIKDIKPDPATLDIVATGQRLEKAKDQLVDIVDMTEKATMNIMDLTDRIQDDLGQAQSVFQAVDKLEIMSEDRRQAFLDQLDGLVTAYQAARPGLEQSQKQLDEAIDLLEGLPGAPAGSPAPAQARPKAGPRFKTELTTIFPLNDLFQILYELCSSEEVKKHIKAVWNKIEEFDAAAVNAQLNAQAEGFERDEGFIMVPLEPLFKALFVATANKQFKETIKKLNAARNQLFLDQSLPVEVKTEETQVPVETEPEPEPEPEPKPAPASLAGLPAGTAAELTRRLKHIRAGLDGGAAFEPDLNILESIKSVAFVESDQSEAAFKTLASFKSLFDRIMGSVNGIIESLSFQDLAGQRIQKIVATISQFQVELLKLLVTFRARMEVEEQTLAASESEKKEIAQRDVDKLLDKLGLGEVDETADLQAGPAAGGRLDQGTVDDMLKQLGF